MRIRIFTNEVAGGWNANDLETFLGGSEECIVLLSEALARSGYDVNVYHTFSEDLKKSSYKRNSVKYHKRDSARTDKKDILLTFKDSLPWRGLQNNEAVRVHLSAEVEQPWDTRNLHYFVCLSDFHSSRIVFVPEENKTVIPLGVDKESLIKNKEFLLKNKCSREPNTMLYCSSPDRGLLRVLSDWCRIVASYPEMKLKVAYGFKNFDRMATQGKVLKNNLMRMMKQKGITYLGQLTKDELEQEYYKSEYWVLPLFNPESELFCLNAVKSWYCGCKSVVSKIGALKNTVGDYIPYASFVDGQSSIINDKCTVSAMAWDQVVSEYWIPLFEKILNQKK